MHEKVRGSLHQASSITWKVLLAWHHPAQQPYHTCRSRLCLRSLLPVGRLVMHTSSSRLVCHASNRFSPAIALQEYFIAPTPPNAVQRRLSSNVSSTEQAKLPPTINAEEVVVEDGDVQPTPTVEQAQRPRPTWTPKMSKGQEHVRISLNVYSAAEKFNIRKIHRDIKVQPGSLVAADLHRTQLLQAARSAFETFTDYEGRKIRPLRIPRGYNEKDLPWVVPNKEQYTSGLDRCGSRFQYIHLWLNISVQAQC